MGAGFGSQYFGTRVAPLSSLKPPDPQPEPPKPPEDTIMTTDDKPCVEPSSKPPDPPRKTWKDLVTGGPGENRPMRIAISFPEGDDGEPEIIVSEDVISSLAMRDYRHALDDGPWVIFGRYLITKEWSPLFNPEKDVLTIAPTWVRVENLPMLYYKEGVLMIIAESIGRPVRVDAKTLFANRGRFARVCVENLHQICEKCGRYGHLGNKCSISKNPEQNPGNPSGIAMNGEQSNPTTKSAEDAKEQRGLHGS
ncbi:hypothetical protein V2J09_021415 [Rumex salicifolius]